MFAPYLYCCVGTKRNGVAYWRVSVISGRCRLSKELNVQNQSSRVVLWVTSRKLLCMSMIQMVVRQVPFGTFFHLCMRPCSLRLREEKKRRILICTPLLVRRRSETTILLYCTVYLQRNTVRTTVKLMNIQIMFLPPPTINIRHIHACKLITIRHNHVLIVKYWSNTTNCR